MKKISFLLLIAGMAIFNYSDLSADARHDTRKRCTRYISYRYKTQATICGKQMSQGQSKQDAGCLYAQATAYAVNNGGLLQGGNQKGNITGRNSSAGGQRTNGYNSLYFDAGYDSRSVISKYNSSTKANAFSVGSYDITSKVDFVDSLTTNNNIRFNHTSGYLLIPNNDASIRYTYEVIIWEANSDLDSVITSLKILKQSSFVFTNANGYQSYGDLFNQGATIVQTDSGAMLQLNNLKDSTMSFDATKNIVITVRLHIDNVSYGGGSSIIEDKNLENSTNSYLQNEVGFNKFDLIETKENDLKLIFERNILVNNSNEVNIENIGIDGKVIGNKIKLALPQGTEQQTIFINRNDLYLKTGINFLRLQYGNEIFIYRLFIISE